MEICFKDINTLLDESKRFKNYLSKYHKIKISKKISLDLLSKGYGFLDFETIKEANVSKFKAYEDLTVNELIELKSQKITIIQKRFENEHSKKVTALAIEEGIKPLKTTEFEFNKYLDSKSKLSKIFGKKEKLDITQTFIDVDVNGKPILLSDSSLRMHTLCCGEQSKISDLYKRLLFQKIEKDEPFIYIKDRNNKTNIIEEIQNYSKYLSSSREIEILDDKIRINLLDQESFLSLFEGTEVYKREFKNNPSELSLLYRVLSIFNIAVKARYSKNIHHYSLIEDCYSYKEIIEQANNFLYKPFEDINIEETLNSFKKHEISFVKMVDEISAIKDKLIHDEQTNYLVNLEHANKSYVIIEPENNILMSALMQRLWSDVYGLLGCKIDDINDYTEIVNKKPKCRKTKLYLYDNYNEYINPVTPSQFRALGIGMTINGNNIKDFDSENTESILANTISKIYYKNDTENKIFKELDNEKIKYSQDNSYFYTRYIEDMCKEFSVSLKLRELK